MTTQATPQIISFWEQCLTQAEEFFQEDDYEEAFITLLALTVTMFKLDHWLVNNDDLETVVSVMNLLNAAWKTCLGKPLQELGVVGEQSDLINWLHRNAETVKLINPTVPDFKWKLE